ncbi:MAG: deoxyribodipyrimidine photo-lyase [Truepera sp.]|nr:deoxyribodipyrimidine photo-lyase [Truepera sp.]
MTTPVIVWHRGDLRLHDHPALTAALAEGTPLPLLILDEQLLARADLTPRRQAWFVQNAEALRQQYRRLGSELVVRRGRPEHLLPELAQSWGVRAVHFLPSHTPYGLQRDRQVAAALRTVGIRAKAHDGRYLHRPGTLRTDGGEPYRVYTPFMKRLRLLPRAAPLAAPERLPPLPVGLPPGELPELKSDIPLPEAGEAAALAQLQTFISQHLQRYHQNRNFPAKPGTSRLSPYLTLGVLSARLAYHLAELAGGEGAQVWQNELIWREFQAHLLASYPDTLESPLNPRWQGFPWRDEAEALAAWRAGQTGYPLVDAGMLELAATGYMHNRVRMVTASFLTKHLLIDWRQGERIFRALLLDGDTAQNVGNWQWTAGCGADAAPYFRVFNPLLQAAKFDPDGDYIRRWCFEPGLPPMIDQAAARARYLEVAQAHLSRAESLASM